MIYYDNMNHLHYSPIHITKLSGKRTLRAEKWQHINNNHSDSKLAFRFPCRSTQRTTWDWVPLASLMLAAFGQALGSGPIPWILSSEYFPTSIRSQVGHCGVSVIPFTAVMFHFVIYHVTISTNRKRFFSGAALQFIIFYWSQHMTAHAHIDKHIHTYLWISDSHDHKPNRQWASARWSAACSPSRPCNSSVQCKRS